MAVASHVTCCRIPDRGGLPASGRTRGSKTKPWRSRLPGNCASSVDMRPRTRAARATAWSKRESSATGTCGSPTRSAQPPQRGGGRARPPSSCDKPAHASARGSGGGKRQRAAERGATSGERPLPGIWFARGSPHHGRRQAPHSLFPRRYPRDSAARRKSGCRTHRRIRAR
jgi:hypothetical protein